METHVEQEVKLQVPRRFDLRLLEAGVNGLSASPVEEHKLFTVYYDTEDLRLIRWGSALRHRKGQGWTLKLSVADEDRSDDGIPAVKRVEYNFPDEGTKPPAQALDLVTAFLRGKPVTPVARLRTIRKSLRLHGTAGEEIAEVVDDDVRVMRDGHVADRFRELEVELLEGASGSVLADLTKWLQDAGAGSFDQTSKAVRALGTAAALPPELVVPCSTADSTPADVVRHALASSVEELLHHDVALRINMDPEVVHKARVATRRLRSDLRTLLPLLDEDWAQSLRDHVKWLGDELGSVRDSDVLVARLRRDAAQLPDEDREAAEDVIDLFDAQATAARQRLHGVMHEKRYVELLDELVEAAANPRLSPESEQPATDILPKLVARPWKKLRKAVNSLPNDADDDALHKIRIKAKRCRYAAEAIAPVFGKPVARFAKRMEALQTVLGELHDSVVAEDRLRQIKGEAHSFVAGGLAALEAQAANKVRESWRKAWKKASKRKLRSWM
ncbi:MAG TPA: CYTH and CHAD domain-containing protein [Candidatus Acidoferrales bacterium]|nr:CYTH and CHAD domain-containing protein [Candidatus Acidoferrales bacterium]